MTQCAGQAASPCKSPATYPAAPRPAIDAVQRRRGPEAAVAAWRKQRFVRSFAVLPRFSIITPYLNQERYIAEAIESVLGQTFADWELLLVDDGSTDASPKIAARYAAEDSRIRLMLRPPDARGGAAAARNLGIRAATGDFITFLDADDVYLPQRLGGHAEVLDRHPGLDAMQSGAEWLYEDGRRERDNLGVAAETLFRPPDLVRRLIIDHEAAVPCTCSVTLRRDLVLDVGGFDERLNLYEDQTLWVKIFARRPVLVVPCFDSIYRQHAESTSAHAERAGLYYADRPHQAGRQFLMWVRDYVDGERLDDRALARSLRHWLGLYDERPLVRWASGQAISLARLRRRLRWAVQARLSRR